MFLMGWLDFLGGGQEGNTCNGVLKAQDHNIPRSTPAQAHCWRLVSSLLEPS